MLDYFPNNFFQDCNQKNNVQLQQLALQQFDAMVLLLRSHDIDVLVLQDTATPEKPDAVFPNNWASYHANGTIILYPMNATNRRQERRNDIIETIRKNFMFHYLYRNRNKSLCCMIKFIASYIDA